MSVFESWKVLAVRVSEVFECLLGYLVDDLPKSIFEIFCWSYVVNALSDSSLKLLLQKAPAALDAVELATVRGHPEKLEVLL